MISIVTWLSKNWPAIVIPLAVFVSALIATFWLRRWSYILFDRWAKKTNWRGDEILVHATRRPSILWALIISASLALAVASISPDWKALVNKCLATLFVLSLTLCVLNLINRFIKYYGEQLNIPERAIILTWNIVRIVVIVIAALIIFDVWGAPTTPILLFVAAVILVAILSLRDLFPNLLAWFQINANQNIRTGDYVKLETGEEGYVTEINWRNTVIGTLEENNILIPNSRLVRSTVINYGRPLKKAKQPFHFYTRTHIKELTGIKAKNISELAEVLRTVPDSVIYYHTHNFLEEHHYLTPEPANDFAIWVSDALGDDVLGERLASIDTFEFPTLKALRERFIGIIEEYAAKEQKIRDVTAGREFYFIKSISVILPTPYTAHDLREFVEALRKISIGSLYFHIFESRLRLGRGLNDFSSWLKDNLEENELSEIITKFDPYTYTLEGLRSQLIQLIEKRIK